MAPDSTYAYDDRRDAVVDLHHPAGTPVGLLLLIHGGFWKAEWDRTHTRPMARALAEQGWLVATPEYRRVGADGGWPTTGEDVRLAFNSLAAQVGPIDGSTVVTGHSAGGQLALWLAATGAPVDRVVPLAPVGDLREAISLRLGSHAALALLGDADPDPALIDSADPMTLLEQRPTCDVAIVHGIDDRVVPLSLSRGLVARHPWIELHEVPGGHFEVIEPGSIAWPNVLAALTG